MLKRKLPRILLLLAILMFATALTLTQVAKAEGSANIWTDKADYAPEETVTIFGSGFLANKQVAITLTAPDSSTATIYATTDESGAFTAYYTLDGMEGTYTVTATDGTNTATTTFTEGWYRYFTATISPTTAIAGETKSYTITITNDMSSSSGVVLGSARITIPSGFTSVSIISVSYPSGKPWTATLVSGYIKLNATADSYRLSRGQSVSVTFSATAPGTAGTYTWTTSAWVDRSYGSGTAFTIKGSQPKVTVTAPSQADVAILKTGVSYAHEGDTITYQFTVTNNGPGTAYNVQVIDNKLGNLTAKLPDTTLDVGEVNTFSVDYVVPTPSGDITNTVTATSTTPDPNSANNQASWTVDVLHPAIDVAKSGPTYAHEGDIITYTITVSNPSTDTTMTKVSVIDTLLGDISGSFSASLAPQASETKTFTYTVPSPSGDITNTVTVKYKDALNLVQTDSDSWTVDVLHPAIDVTKSGPLYAHEGDTITYTINVSNTGDCPLYSVSVTDSLLGSIYNNGLAYGETKTFTVSYAIPLSSGDISNTVTASGSDILGLVVSDSASWFVKVQYQITITASPAGAIGGTFKVTYTKCGTTYTNEQYTTTWTEWVDSGTAVTVSVPQQYVPSEAGIDGVRYRFDHYDPSASVNMDKAKTITLVYKTQYRLIMSTNFGTTNPSVGQHWYNESSVVPISATAPSVIVGEQYVWLGWTGTGTISYTGPNNPASVTMNSPITETASWAHQFLLTIKTNGLPSAYPTKVYLGGLQVGTASDMSPYTKWFNSGDSTGTIGVDSVVSGSQYVFVKWVEDSSTSNPRAAETMNSPKTFTALYKTQYYLTVNTDPSGLSPAPTPPSNWYDNSTNVVLTAPSESYLNTVKYNFTYWDVDGIKVTGNPITVHMNQTHTATAHYVPSPRPRPVGGFWEPAKLSIPSSDYTLFITALVAIVAELMGTLVHLRKRSKEKQLMND